MPLKNFYDGSEEPWLKPFGWFKRPARMTRRDPLIQEQIGQSRALQQRCVISSHTEEKGSALLLQDAVCKHAFRMTRRLSNDTVLDAAWQSLVAGGRS
jgi:hypothetical protein